MLSLPPFSKMDRRLATKELYFGITIGCTLSFPALTLSKQWGHGFKIKLNANDGLNRKSQKILLLAVIGTGFDMKLMIFYSSFSVPSFLKFSMERGLLLC